MANVTSAVTANSVTIVRTFDASREAVWRAWTNPADLASWFYTPPFRTPLESVMTDVRLGGEFRATQVNDQDGTRLPFVGTYLEVDEPQRLVLRYENPEDRDDPNVEIATVELRAVGDGTEMTFRQEGHLPPEQYPLLGEGYSKFFDNMERLLRNTRKGLIQIGETTFIVPVDKPTIEIERTFRASAHAIFRAMTEPDLVGRWYGPSRYRVEVPELDARQGGKWRFLNIDKENGTVWAFRGEFREIVPDRRITQTWIFEGYPDVVVEQVAELTPNDGQTTVHVTAAYPDFESREGDLRAGANDGAAETYDRLAEVAKEIAE